MDADTNARTPQRTGGRPRRSDGLTATERAARDCATLLHDKTCSVCGAPATTWVTPPGAPTHARLRAGERPHERSATLAAVTDFRCHEHRPLGRPRPDDGSTRADRARAACDTALAGHTCTRCGAPATTATTPPGAPSFGALRAGAKPHDRDRILAELTDYRCPDHPLSRPTLLPGGTHAEHGARLVADHLATRTCADPGCDARPAGALTPAWLPNLGQVATGEAVTLAKPTLEAAVCYCAPHLAARTTRGINLDTAPDPRVANVGHPYTLATTLADAPSPEHAAEHLNVPLEAARDAYDTIGIDLDQATAFHRLPPPGPAAPRTRAHTLGSPTVVFTALAASCSIKDITRRLRRGSDASGTVRSVQGGFTQIGVDLPTYYEHRLRHHA